MGVLVMMQMVVMVGDQYLISHISIPAKGQFQHGSKWLGTLTSPILLILSPDVPPRELFKTPKNFRPRTPRGGAMPFSIFGDMAEPCTFFFKYLSIYLAGNDKLGING